MQAGEKLIWRVKDYQDLESSITLEYIDNNTLLMTKSGSINQQVRFSFSSEGYCPSYKPDVDIDKIDELLVYGMLPFRAITNAFLGVANNNGLNGSDLSPPSDSHTTLACDTVTPEINSSLSAQQCGGRYYNRGKLFNWNTTRIDHHPKPGLGLIKMTLSHNEKALLTIELVDWNQI